MMVGHFANLWPPVLQLADPDCCIHTDLPSILQHRAVQMMMKIRLMVICSSGMIMIRFTVDVGDNEEPDCYIHYDLNSYN